MFPSYFKFTVHLKCLQLCFISIIVVIANSSLCATELNKYEHIVWIWMVSTLSSVEDKNV